MTFLLPLGLLALLTLPIIALLHLIRQRRNRLRVPSLQIWRELQRTNVQRKPRRLPLTFLLLLHLLLAALLAVALAQPLIEAARSVPEHTAIVLDTSTSMAAVDEAPDRLAAAKQEARRIVGEQRAGDSVALVELSARPAVLARGEGRDTAGVLRALDRVTAGGRDGDLKAAMELAQATARPAAGLRVVVLTDGALRSNTAPAVAGEVEWRTFGNNAGNVAIVAFAARPLRDGRQQLYARVANLGTAPIARTLRLELDGKRVADEPMRLAAGGEAEWSWPLPRGTARAEAVLSGEDAQPIDDRAALVLAGSAQARALLVTPETTALERVFRAQPGLVVETVAPSEYRGRSADLVIFYKYVPPTLPSAPTLLVAPPRGGEIIKVEGYADAVTVDDIRDERFAAVDFRPVRLGSVAQLAPPDWAGVAVAAGELPLVLLGQRDGQPVAIWTFDPADSNLANRLAFPLLASATASALLPRAGDTLPVGVDAPFALDGDGGTVQAGERLSRPGIYRTAGGSIAVNALDAEEASLVGRPAPEITMLARPVAAASTPAGRELWQPFVVAGLLVLALEWLYTNRANPRRAGGRPAARVASKH